MLNGEWGHYPFPALAAAFAYVSYNFNIIL